MTYARQAETIERLAEDARELAYAQARGMDDLYTLGLRRAPEMLAYELHQLRSEEQAEEWAAAGERQIPQPPQDWP